ncbi:hypothetical protein F5Y19DRAFT_108957 [Xylariaceae sp. FL1651]|nr:hypothetical protein F5Y19DRAFT_108957 [Xylariaceae sp. FL1651]
MQQPIVSLLSILLFVALFLAGVLAVPALNQVADPGADLAIYNMHTDLKKSRTSRSHHVVITAASVTPPMVTVTVIETTVVGTVTITIPNVPDTTTTEAPGSASDTQSQRLTIIPVSLISTQPATTLLPQITSMSATNTTFATITTAASSSSFNTAVCDYIYCDEGNHVCIYWAGYSSWDISLGPIPGEIPTVIGTC